MSKYTTVKDRNKGEPIADCFTCDKRKYHGKNNELIGCSKGNDPGKCKDHECEKSA